MKRVYKDLAVIIFFVILTILMTWPYSFNISDSIPGPDSINTKKGLKDSDAWQHIWSIEWVKKAALTDERLYYTNDLFYPDGVSLAFHNLTVFNGLIFILLNLFVSSLLAYNLIFLVFFVLAGYFMYLLAYHLTKNIQASFLAGFLFSFSSFHMARLFVNHLQECSMAWIPLFVLFLLFTFENDKLIYAVIAGIILAVISLSYWYFGLFMLVFTLFFIIWKLSQKKINSSAVKKLSIMSFVFLIITLPFVIPMIHASYNPDYAIVKVSAEYKINSSNDILSFFIPSFLHLFMRTSNSLFQDMNRFYWEMNSYLGILAIFAIIFSTFNKKLRKDTKFWLVSLGLFALFSLGPVLKIAGKKTILNISYLFSSLPFFDLINVPARFQVVVLLCSSVVFAYVFAYFYENLKTKSSKALLFAIVFIFLTLELLVIPFPHAEVQVPEFYSTISQSPENFAILELPLDYSKAMLYQTFHKKPIMSGYLARMPPIAEEFTNSNFFILQLESGYSDKKDLDISNINLNKSLFSLRENDVRFALIHEIDEFDKAILAELKKLTGTRAYMCNDTSDIFFVLPLESQSYLHMDSCSLIE